MATIFVRTSGNDTTGTGLTGAPYASLKKALSVAAAGDVILMGDGTYAEDSGSGYLAVSNSFSSRVTVASETGFLGGVIVTGTGTAWGVIFQSTVKNLHFDGIIFRAQSNTVNAPVRFTQSVSSGLTWTRCRFQGWSASGQTNGCISAVTSSGNAWTNYTFASCYFDQIGIYPCYGISMQNTGGGGTTASGWEVYNCTFDTSYYGARFNGVTGMEVHGNDFRCWSPLFAATPFTLGFDGTTGVASSGVISGNKFRTALGHGVMLGAGCDGVLFADNDVWGGADTTNGQGLVVKHATNVRIERGVVVGGYLSGLYFKAATDCQAFDVIVRNRYATSSALRLDFDPADSSLAQRITVRRCYLEASAGAVLSIPVNGDGGGSVIDENVYVVRSGASLGVVRDVTVSTLTGLRAAWSVYDKPNNDRNSRMGITQPKFAGTPVLTLPA